ncbi:GntR family transcriptional regulator [Nonomuraea sp. NPDC050394]|uniref:GntR family transcriptional regulator n=1 Tax=Nonomuraea sp. NPDC050394 TaxID=3364363 RepID=UPI003789B300
MSEPLYRKVADDLRKKITAGSLQPGQRLPSQSELEQLFGVSTNTVRLAIAVLANEGLVESRQGLGTYVNARLTFTMVMSNREGLRTASGKDAFTSAVEEQGRQPAQEGFTMEFREASPKVASYLQIPEGSVVVVRLSRRLVDGESWSLQDSFYPLDVAEGTGLMLPVDLERGTIRELADHGHVQVRHRDVVLARMPTPQEVPFFGRRAGVPVIEVIRTAYSAERPIRLTVAIYAGDMTHLAYEINYAGSGHLSQ